MDKYITSDIGLAWVMHYFSFPYVLEKIGLTEQKKAKFQFVFETEGLEQLAVLKSTLADYYKGAILVEPRKFNNCVRDVNLRMKESNE